MQPGFFDLDNRLQQLEALGDPLPKLNAVVDWEAFRPVLIKIRQKPAKAPGGRPLYDVVLMFKVLVLQHLYNLADEQTEYQIRDRYSFCHFLGLTPEGKVPDARSLWVFREALKEHDLVDELFAHLNGQITAADYNLRQGQIVNASMVAAPRQRNNREDNAKIKQGETPEDCQDKPSMLRQKDKNSCWTKKHGESHYGYKNHINVDKAHKLNRRDALTYTSVHDSQVFDEVLDDENGDRSIWADSAYQSEAREEQLRERGYQSRIHRKGTSRRSLNKQEQATSHRRSKVRARVEHVFGDQRTRQGSILVRTKGIVRAALKIGLMNLTYNMRRLEFLLRPQSVCCTS